SPWELAREKNPKIRKEALMLPTIDLDAEVRNIAFCAQGGNDVFTNPSVKVPENLTITFLWDILLQKEKRGCL
ncbi:MAG: hypothetical protein ABIG55_07085, partial [Candidatus Omnitrophota bacterium]